MRTPPSPRDDLRFSHTTGILQKKNMWFIGVEVEQETSAPPPEKNPGSAPEVSYKDKRMSILYRTLQKKIIRVDVLCDRIIQNQN